MKTKAQLRRCSVERILELIDETPLEELADFLDVLADAEVVTLSDVGRIEARVREILA